MNRGEVVNPSNVDLVVGIQRNSEGQIYAIPDLDISLHGTVPSGDFNKFVNHPFPSLLKCSTPLSQPIDGGKDSFGPSRMVPFLHIPSSENALCASQGVCVINDGRKWCIDNGTVVVDECSTGGWSQKRIDDPIQYCASQVLQMFENGLSDYFIYDRKKRSVSSNHIGTRENTIVSHCSVSFASIADPSINSRASSKFSRGRRIRKNRSKNKRMPKSHKSSATVQRKEQRQSVSSLPTVTLGWSQTNAHAYKDNKVTIAGNVQPFLRDSSLPENVRTHVLNCVNCVLSTIPISCSFRPNDDDDQVLKKLRQDMLADFDRLLGGDGKRGNFLVEGITILIPLSIGFHKDTNNCGRKGMRAVLQMNVKVPMNARTIRGGRSSVLWKWLERNGYLETFPATMILYGRKSVSSICEKLSKMETFARKDDLRRCVKWAFLDRVDSGVNFEKAVWNNDKFRDYFIRSCGFDQRKGPRSFNGRMWSTTAYYQKIVSTSMSSDVLFHFHLRPCNILTSFAQII